jgi:putative glutamine amidotransferase
MQVLNIVLGGTLVQDIGNDEHWMREHSVKLVEGSIIANLVGDTHLDHCHSVHHQGIAELGAGLVPIGYSEDGQLEAVELPSKAWVVGLQWHPEDTATRQPQQQAIYDELVRRAGLH